MKHLENLILYFCEYEMYNSLLANAINDKNAKDVILEQCNYNFVFERLLDWKCEKIWLSLKSKLSADCSRVDKANIKDYVNEVISLDALFELLSFKNRKYLSDPKANTNKIYCEQHFCVYYPVILNRKKQTQQPMLSFIYQLLTNSFKVNKIYANKEMFALLIAQHNNIELVDARLLYEDQLNELASAVDAIHEANGFQDVYQVVCGEFNRIFGTDLGNFNNTKDWQMLEKAVVSFEPLDSIVASCFRDEMNCFMRFYKENSLLPQTLAQYLKLSPHNATEINDVTPSHSHVGSYQSKYPINNRQWELTQLVANANLLCVEGPPGTGKTTLLKEIIADTIVKKADRLIEVWEDGWINLGDKCKMINRSPMGGENLNSIVIASTNTKAVDNIGLELLKEIPFFEKFAKNVKLLKDKEACCSGILCARLGRSEIIGFFYHTVFMPFCEYLKTYEITDDEAILAKEHYMGFREKLKQINTSIYNFLALREQLPELTSTTKIYETVAQLETEHQSLERSKLQFEQERIERKNEIETLNNNIACMEQERLQAEGLLKSSEENQHTLYSDLNEYEHIGMIKKLFRFLLPKVDILLKKYASAEQIRDMIQEAKKMATSHQAHIDEVTKTLFNSKRQLIQTEETIAKLLEMISECENSLFFLTTKKTLLDTYLKQIIALAEQIQCSTDDVLGFDIFEINNTNQIIALRHSIFLAANSLTEAYICYNKEPILQNLNLILEETNYEGVSSLKWCKTLYNGDKPYDEDRASLIRDLWETFFLCFPVITTTLHSLQRNTYPLIPNLFDMLMIDEGGQVVPYYVVAPLYRARKAIFVGDIHQIEPIKNVPPKLLEKKYTKILGEKTYADFCIDLASAQSFAAPSSDYYEYVQKQASGIILSEHRRCEPAIMAFSNQYIYHNMLKLIGENDCNKLFGSNLIAFDIRGNKASRHYNQTEIDACKNIVDLYVSEYGEDIKSKIGIITPFKQQAIKIQDAIHGVEAGTVHVFQGAEKEYIIFSGVVDNISVAGGLGSFVGAKGNLLNVAFSRAKKQFIYIGNVQAAKSANNYLSFAVETIKSYGKTFSLFDATNAETHSDTKVISVLAGQQTIYRKDDIFNYLQTIIPQKIISSPKMHNEILLNVLRFATQSVYIISPWIGGNVVDAKLIDIIKKRLDQKIDVNIAFGHKATQCSLSNIDDLVAQDVPWERESSANAIKTLKMLLGDNLKYVPPSHVKLLLADDKYLFIGSLNWLFNSGKSEQQEISCLITNPNTISYVKNTFL